MKHEFVEHMPEKLEDDTIYVSISFEIVMHKCACGCGNEVVTPLSPAEWSVTFDGETISLYPSIGNWSLACKSHYWIRKNKIEWSTQWSKEEIEEVKNSDFIAKKEYYEKSAEEQNKDILDEVSPVKNKSIWSKFRSWFK
ncbi:DUF6527 family protein [Flagellimonas chongwuensis]|uniref:DUF6527 family protein n=1 Tax=Flagellimonas chongwuensis TaxID=2697365 RepID=UPI00159E8DEC|nr:DUF6527 family protein [Allomuricauda chongwuensis]